jgi:cytoskeleton protein RodZ
LGDSPLLREVGGRAAGEVPSLCVALRSARMAAGYELADISTALRIRLLYLEALEEGRFDDLPGNTYAIGFLRSYAEFLELDPNEMVERFKSETKSGMELRDLSFPMPPKEGRNPKPWLILVVVLLAGLAYGGWHVYSTEGQIATNLVSDVSNTLTEAAGLSDDEDVMAAVATESFATEEEASVGEAPVASQVVAEENSVTANAASAPGETALPQTEPEQTADAMVDVGADAGAVETVTETVETETTAEIVADAPRQSAASTSEPQPLRSDSLWDRAAASQPDEPAEILQSPPAQSSETVPIIRNANAQVMDEANSDEIAIASASPDGADAPAYEPQIYGEENADFRIAIKATADSWVQIQGPNNELLLTRILRTGDIYQVPDRLGLLMVTGNAGALEVRVDGALVEALGPIGVVRRNVSLDPETLVAASQTER